MQVLCTITPSRYSNGERVRRNHAVLMDSFKFHENNVPREQKAQVKSLQRILTYKPLVTLVHDSRAAHVSCSITASC